MSEAAVKKTVMVGLLSALAMSIVVSGVSKYLSFPILSYLKFDPAEIPAFIGLFLGGLKVGLGVSIFHYVFLLWFGEFTPVGPTMKFLAVASTLIGWSFGEKLTSTVWVKLLASSLFRVAVMTIANVYVLLFIYPDWISSIGKMLGMDVSNTWNVLLVILGLTGVYNVLHVVLVNYLASKIIVDRVKAVIEHV